MDYKYIEQLLERYFQAETTLEEEQILRAFFLQKPGDMPAALQQYAPLFDVMAEKPKLDADFDERILALTEGTVQVKAKTIKMGERLKPFLRAAAVVAVILTLGNAIKQAVDSDDGVWDSPAEYSAEAASIQKSGAVMAEQGTDSMSLAIDQMTVQEDSVLNGKID